MLVCKLNGRGRGSDIFLISAQNIDVGESQSPFFLFLSGALNLFNGCSHNILFYVAMLTYESFTCYFS